MGLKVAAAAVMAVDATETAVLVRVTLGRGIAVQVTGSETEAKVVEEVALVMWVLVQAAVPLAHVERAVLLVREMMVTEAAMGVAVTPGVSLKARAATLRAIMATVTAPVKVATKA